MYGCTMYAWKNQSYKVIFRAYRDAEIVTIARTNGRRSPSKTGIANPAVSEANYEVRMKKYMVSAP